MKKTLFALLLAAGCNTTTLVQTMSFVDDNGNVIEVDYSRAEKEHIGKCKSPMTGEDMDFRTKLLVKVTMPDGSSFKAWQTMNVLPSGTMYRSDDERWLFHARGIVSSVYERTIDKTDYKLVYEGAMYSGGDNDRRGKKKGR